MEFIKLSVFAGIGATLLKFVVLYVVLYFVIKYAVKSALKENK